MRTPKPLPEMLDKFVYENLLGRVEYLRVLQVDEGRVCFHRLVDPLFILGENQPPFWGNRLEWMPVGLWRRKLGKTLHKLLDEWQIETHYCRPLPPRHYTGKEWEVILEAARALPRDVCKGYHDDACEDYNAKRQRLLLLLGAR